MTLCTQGIQSAINRAWKDGGGRVVIPKGEFVSGTVFLRSNVQFYFLKGAKLLGSLNPDDYQKVGKWKALIIADRTTNVGLAGKGCIDGRGDKLALKIDSLFYAGQIDSADYNFIEQRPKWTLRPLLLEFLESDKITIQDITLKNSSCWVQTYELCNNLLIKNITVDSDTYWNNDGIDIVDCKNVKITDCDINTSDDGICIKSEDWSRKRFCDSIEINNCRVRSSASAIKLGTSSVSHMRNITIRNIEVYDTYRSAIAIEAMQGGILENILVEKILDLYMSNDEWRNWIKTSGYIGYVGCSFTWGQGLWNYDKNNKNTPTYDEFIFENIQPTEESDNVRKELRYPNLLSTHFGTDVISKMMNGGSDAQSYTILEDVINSRSQNPEMSGKWPLEKMRLLIFQHSALVRNNHVFDYKGKKYRVNLKGGEHHVHIDDDNDERERDFGVFEIYPWQSIKINGDTKEQYEQCSQD